jgi:hypothetical protein
VVHVIERALQLDRGSSLGVRVAPGLLLLTHADLLEVAAEEGRHADLVAGGVLALHLMDQDLHLEVVVLLRLRGAARVVAVGGDLELAQVVHAGARGAVHQVVGEVLVAPRGAQAGGLGDLEDRVHPQEVVGVDRRAVVVRVAGHVRGIETPTAIQLGQIQFGALVEENLGSDGIRAQRGTGAIRDLRWAQAAVVGIVVPDAGHVRAATGDERQESGERVGRTRAGGGGEVHPVIDDLGEVRLGICPDVVGQIQGVQPVDADQEHVLHFVISGGCGSRGDDGDSGEGDRCDSHQPLRCAIHVGSSERRDPACVLGGMPRPP